MTDAPVAVLVPAVAMEYANLFEQQYAHAANSAQDSFGTQQPL
jgi:hypothetical protein